MQRPIYFLVICFMLCSFAVQAQPGSKTAGELATAHFNEGEDLLLNRKYEQALRSFEKAIKLQPGMLAAQRAAGYCSYFLRSYDKALNYFLKVVETDSMFSRIIYFQVADAYYKLGKPQLALQYFEKFKALQAVALSEFGFQAEKEVKMEVDCLWRLSANIQACKVSMDSLKFLNITEVRNLGPRINTRHDDYFPFLTNDQKKLFYTQHRNQPEKEEDLFYSEKEDGEWQSSTPFKGLNTPSFEGMSTFIRDGRRLYYTACGRENVLGPCDIWEALVNGEEVTGAGPVKGVLNSENWDSQAAVNCDGTVIYFSSNRAGGLGGTDIWRSEKRPDGSWSQPVNLGVKINTPENEEAPFISNDGKTLYFSSEGHLGLGDQDIFMSWLDVRTNQWSTPVNLGPPVNSPFRELGLFLTADGKTGYFASDRPGGQGQLDIYNFDLSDKLFGDPITYVEGFVRDSILLIGVKTDVAVNGKPAFKTDDNGRFFMCVGADETLDFGITQKGYFPYHNEFVVPEWSNKTFYTIEMLLRPTLTFTNAPEEPKKEKEPVEPPTPKGVKVNYQHTAFFQFDDHTLTPSEADKLESFLGALKNKKILKVEIIGFADDIGTDVYNLRISEERAKEVALALVRNNIVIDQIYLQGRGEIKNDDPKAMNRRVEVRITAME
ncbi:MAG: PD40 domain-containing protein [Lewinella sp.]|nr:PD40 domain-containing protein [Lewinella sp.]